MRGLGYIKGQEHPIAGEDDEYPDWLWGLLDRKGESGTSSEEGAKGDMFCEFGFFLFFIWFGGSCLIEWILYSCLDARPPRRFLFSFQRPANPSHAAAKSKNQRRIALKAARKAARDPASQIPKVPYDRQTIDLPVAESQDGRVEGDMAGGPRGWEEAQRAREDLTHAMRNRRRKEIKDSNFLKSIKT